MRITSVALLTAACFVASVSIQAQTAGGQSDFNRRYRSNYEVPKGEQYTGRSPYMRPATEAEPPPPVLPARVEVAQAPRMEAPRPAQSCADPTVGLIRMGKRMPAEVTLGQEFMYELTPTATACAGNVVITDRIPQGATYVRSEPPAQVQGDKLIWNLGDMEAGEARDIKVWLKADQEGRLASCATVSADPRVCASTFVGKPVLALEKTGPAAVRVGDDVSYMITVSNKGTAPARDVVVVDPVPEGLVHSSGQSELTFNVGELAPNQSKSFPVNFKFNKRGQVCNVAVARSSNAGEVKAEACTTGALVAIKIAKDGDKQQLVGKVASYRIVITNEGDVDVPDLRVTDTAPEQTTIVAADGATVTGNTAVWNVPMLEKGTEKTFDVKLTSRVPGSHCNNVVMSTVKGLTFTAQACTEWIGVTGVLVEVVDDPDPIQVGETTTFTIRVTNQGSTREIEEVNVKSVFAAEMTPVTASSGGTVQNNTVTWPTLARLAPKQSVTYTVVGKGVKAGDHRLETQVTTRLRENPIVELESTTVY